MKNEVVLQLDPTPTNGRNSEASFVTLNDGTIMLAWSKFTSWSSSDFGAALIAARFSKDGRTWSGDDVVIVKQEGSTNVMSPSLLRLQDGRIALLTLRKDGEKQCMPYIRFSSDEAQTFTDPQLVIPEPGYYVVNNDRMIQMRNGRIVIPVGHHRFRGPSTTRVDPALAGDETVQVDQKISTFLASPATIIHYFSDDGGATWLESLTSFYHCSETGHGLEEPGVVELSDGRLWSYTRTGMIGLGGYGGRQWQSFSADGGQVWSDVHPSQFVSPCSPMQVKRIPKTGDLIAIWNDHSEYFKVDPPLDSSWARTPLVLAISSDDGATWGHRMLIEGAPDHGYCYPAVHFTDEAVLLSYNAGGASSKNPLDTQRVRWISLDEIYSR